MAFGVDMALSPGACAARLILTGGTVKRAALMHAIEAVLHRR
jgi:hypothetical protein